jgi:cytochrome c-type biogenesis protein CcmH/NrfG
MPPPQDTDSAIRQHEDLLAQDPNNDVAHFNLALLYKRAGRHDDAVASYQRAIDLGIDDVQEVYSNLGVLYSEMRQPALAREAYEKSLSIEPDYIPALFNLAGLLEEQGEREQAIGMFERILAIEPRYWDALARIANARRIERPDDPLFDKLQAAVAATADEPQAREGLLFALGKALDDVGRYREAFDAYRQANELGKRLRGRYDAERAKRAITSMLARFDQYWLTQAETSSEASPIFICGMYRSGSTLVEQILSAHASVQMGGELDVLPRLLTERLTPFPQRLADVTGAELAAVADEYMAALRQLFPGATHVTDKRPDNVLHLGVIRAMFPKAKVVLTRRELRDNCLSAYFQQLGAPLSYATDLADTAHYYRQQERLVARWRELLGENIFTVDYDELVRDPEPVLRGLLDFLELPWDPACLEFQRARSQVKTASIWQVREPLHTRSSGRWRNYQPHVGHIDALTEQGE